MLSNSTYCRMGCTKEGYFKCWGRALHNYENWKSETCTDTTDREQIRIWWT